MRQTLLAVIITLSLALNFTALAQDQNNVLIPIDGGDVETFSGFIKAVLNYSLSPDIRILVIPTGFGSNLDNITQNERDQILAKAEKTRNDLEFACKQQISTKQDCQVILAPIMSKAEASDQVLVESFFEQDPSAIFLLGNDQKSTDPIICGTYLEDRLARAYEGGVLISGTYSGALMQSKTMLMGYREAFENSDALDFGAVQLLNSSSQHGLSFGLQNAVLDYQAFTQGHIGRLMNAISSPDSPHVGIGLDQGTGLQIIDGKRLDQVFGKSAITVLDADTYHSALAVQYSGDRNTLSLRNVLVHLLSPGDDSYDLSSRQHSLGTPVARLERNFSNLDLPQNAGSLLLSGILSSPLEGHPVLVRFINLSGGKKANIQIVALGFSSTQNIETVALPYLQEINTYSRATLNTFSGSDTLLDIPSDTTGILLLSDNSASLQPNLLSAIENAWKSGVPVMAAGDAASLIGNTVITKTKPGPSKTLVATSLKSLQLNADPINQVSVFSLRDEDYQSGLSLVRINLVPDVMKDNHWSDLFSLAFHNPENIAFGLTADTALELHDTTAKVIGSKMIISLDLRTAKLGTGENGAPIIANGLIDTFTSNEMVAPYPADMNAVPIAAATPVAPSPSPTLSPTATLAPTETPAPPPADEQGSGHPTRTLRPTATPRTPPPPSDPGMTSLMIAFGVMAVVVVIFGLLINRGRQ